MKIGIVGTGHVGLVTGVAFASLGHRVVATDVDRNKIRFLNAGKAPFREPGLDELLESTIAEDRIRFVESLRDAVADADVVFVCVGRPTVGNGDRSVGAVEEAVRSIARAATPGSVVVVKSTVPPGTTDRAARVIHAERPDLDVDVVSSPEFLREGHALDDTLAPDRLVIGSTSPRATQRILDLYANMLRNGAQPFVTDPATAELSKLASNAFLALKISYANAVARIGELVGADARDVSRIMGADPRIGDAFLGAGLGFGGYCLPKDVMTLERQASKLGYDFGLLREVTRVNDEALEAVRGMIEEAVWNLEGKRIALFGLAFKDGVDDVRGSRALALAESLMSGDAHVVGYDPVAAETAAGMLPSLTIAADPYEAAEGASCIVVCEGASVFSALDLERLRSVVASPVVVDGRNTLDGATISAAGFLYLPVGAPPLG
jgi:UDPglucose 6-dehydrogenase